MLDSFLIVLLHSFAEHILADDLANVLEDEVVRLERRIDTQPIALLLRLDHSNIGIKFLLKASILTARSATTFADAFHLGGAVDTVRIFSTGIVDVS